MDFACKYGVLMGVPFSFSVARDTLLSQLNSRIRRCVQILRHPQTNGYFNILIYNYHMRRQSIGEKIERIAIAIHDCKSGRRIQRKNDLCAEMESC